MLNMLRLAVLAVAIVVRIVVAVVVVVMMMMCLQHLYLLYHQRGTKKEYLIRLRYFFDAIHVPGKTLADQASNFLSQIAAAANPNPKYGQDCLQKFKGYLKERL